MNRRNSSVLLAAALTAAACFNAPPLRNGMAREQTLDQAFAVVASDPTRAAELFAKAGSGTALEHARLTSWADCLDRGDAAPEAWRRYLADEPPPTLAARARVALLRTLAAEGPIEAMLAERSLLPAGLRPEVDELLLTTDDPEIRLQAARRLAVSAPQRLRAIDRELERILVRDLTPEEHLERSRSWRHAGAPARAAAELRTLRWRGETEALRRRELARAELAAGSPRRSLSALPSGSDADAEDLSLRAQAYRHRAWQLFPDRRSNQAFGDCLTAAGTALLADPEQDLLAPSLGLLLECATEAGRLETALETWWRLEALGWSDSRREWLGRRLGVALARGGMTDAARELARSLPEHERCLQYWAADGGEGGDLADLAAADLADLYGQWSRQALGLEPSEAVDLAPPAVPSSPPPPVHRLLAAGAEREAIREWRRIRGERDSSPDEALAAAELASRRGLSNEAIRWLRAGFPELGTVAMITAPENAVRAYLPLRWQGALVSAAHESDLDPWLLAAVARQESVFSAAARSPRGAIGVLQLLPNTASGHARALGLGRSPDLQDPELNLRLGARELARLKRRFGALEPALAAYNAGETRVRGWWKRWPERHRFTEEVPIPETYNYIRRVLYLSEAYRLVYHNQWRRTP